MWIILTPADLSKRLSSREMDALRRASAAFDDAAAQEILDQTADTARGYIAGWSKNRLAAAAHSIPPSLKATCLDIALVDYSQSCAGMLIDPKGLRAKAAERALARLKDVAKGEFTIEQPSAAEAAAASGSGSAPTPPSTYEKPSSLSRDEQKGSW